VENTTTRTAAPTSYSSNGVTLMTPPFAMSGATGVPAVWSTGLQIAGMVAVVDQRPRTAKLGRPPRGNHC
jgi:hypothetical protein